MKCSTIKEVEETIRKAVEIDRMLPSIKPRSGGSLLGRMIVIPDNERSLDDVLADVERNRNNITREDIALWYHVLTVWIPPLDSLQREIVKLRCSGMGWKRIGKHLAEHRFSDRVLYRTTLWRIFREALEAILRKN